MSISMHQAFVPASVRALQALADILKKAAASAEARKIDPTVLLNSRLSPDMFPLVRQVQIATDGPKGCAARLQGVEPPSWPDVETTFDELQTRVATAIAYLKAVTPESLDGSETREIVLKVGGAEMPFTGLDYLQKFVLPNLYFHVSTAYLILRHNGVDLGKRDFLALTA